MMIDRNDDPLRARVMSACVGATRVLVLKHLQDDTFVITEGGEVSLSSGETLKRMLRQLNERTDQ